MTGNSALVSLFLKILWYQKVLIDWNTGSNSSSSEAKPPVRFFNVLPSWPVVTVSHPSWSSRLGLGRAIYSAGTPLVTSSLWIPHPFTPTGFSNFIPCFCGNLCSLPETQAPSLETEQELHWVFREMPLPQGKTPVQNLETLPSGFLQSCLGAAIQFRL